MEEDNMINFRDSKYPIVKVVNKQGVGEVYSVFIYSEIGLAEDFIDIISLLERLEEIDTVIFKINSPGGYLHSALSLISAIRTTRAGVFADCSGTIASAATLIALNCDDLHIAPYSEFMSHSASGGVFGKDHEVAAAVLFSEKNNKKIMLDMYDTFLTQEEIYLLSNGKDFYFSSEEVQQRWDLVMKSRQAEIERQNAEAQQHQELTTIAYLKGLGYNIRKQKELK